MPFRNENESLGILRRALYQQGRSDADDDVTLERGISLPWSSDPAGSYVYYDCAISTVLDSGVVVHNQLPQVNRTTFDTLAATDLNNSNLDQLIDAGVNLRSQDQYTDIVQRMGHARYWFRIWGQALRIGYKVPIPGIKTIGGVPAIPYDKNPQWSYNRIAPGGNYSGAVLWHAAWSLWYTTTVPPTTQDIPAADPAAHIRGDVVPPGPQRGMQSPYSQSDDNAQITGVS